MLGADKKQRQTKTDPRNGIPSPQGVTEHQEKEPSKQDRIYSR